MVAPQNRIHVLVLRDYHGDLLVLPRGIAQAVENSVAPGGGAEFLLGPLVVERGVAEIFVGGREGDGRLDEPDEGEAGVLRDG